MGHWNLMMIMLIPIKIFILILEGLGGSMSYLVGLPNKSYKRITKTACARARLCILQKGCTRLSAASDKVYQLLAHGRWFSPGTPILPPLKLVAMIYR